MAPVAQSRSVIRARLTGSSKRRALLLRACLLFRQVLLNQLEAEHGRRWWVRPIWEEREQEGEYHTAMQRMRDDPDFFRRYYRMSPATFEKLHSLLEEKIRKKDVGRKPLESRQRLAIAIRYLSSGDLVKDVALAFRVGLETARLAIHDCTNAMWEVLQPLYMKQPTASDFKEIAEGFQTRWQFPNCIGAVDGKHVTIEAPKNSGSRYYNYKGTFSIILLAVVDSSYRFILVDVGAYGRQSDGGVLRESEFGKDLINNSLDLPEMRPLPGTNEFVPHVFVGDEAFQLRTDFMRPFPGRHISTEKRIFNYRLSRARRCVENAFGILSTQWRIFRRPINLKEDNVDNIIKACCVLHNFLRTEELEHPDDVGYCPHGLADSEGSDGRLEPGRWRQEVENEGSCMSSLQPTLARNFSQNAATVRQKFVSYFTSTVGAVPWQWAAAGTQPPVS